MTGVSTATGLYVYGVVRAGAPRPLEREDVALVVSGPLAAITTTVSLDEFGESALKEHLNDRAWLEEKARSHEDILWAASATTAVVPFRFGTICHSPDDVRALLDEHRDEFAAGLDRVDGRVELGVKLWVDVERLEAALEPSPSAPSGTSGRSYLEARRAEQRRSTAMKGTCLEVSRRSYERLADRSLESVSNRPQPRELTGRNEEMLFNAAFLVDAGDRTLADEVARLNVEHEELGFTFELTGPWPAHNFVALPEEDR